MSTLRTLIAGVALSAVLLSAASAAAKSFQVLHAFTGGLDGGQPNTTLVLRSGRLYGSTPAGGAFGAGTVFRYDLGGGTLTTLHGFTGGSDGRSPQAGMIVDAAGLLYGTTLFSGSPASGGVVFRLNPASRVLTSLHAFRFDQNGGALYGGVTRRGDALYGTTNLGGGAVPGAGLGTVFKLDLATRSLTTLHAFSSRALAAGGAPRAAPVFDSAGLLYGTTSTAGTFNAGTLYRLNPTTRAFSVLHQFTGGTDGGRPHARLVLRNGALFGTTWAGGAFGQGTVFR